MNKISIVALTLIMISVDSISAEVDYGLRIGATRSDNVHRTASAEVDDTFWFAGFVLDLSHNSRMIDLKIDSDLEYQSYVDDTFDDDVVGAFSGELIVNLVPKVLTWVVRDNFGQIQGDPFAALTPDSREDFNSFATGPELQIRLGRVTGLNIGALYTNNQYEVRDIDHEVFGAQVGLIRSLSPNRSVSLNISSDRIEFDNTDLNSNYDRQSAFFNFSSEMSRGSISINAGVNEIHDRGESANGFFGGFSMTRQLSSRSNLRFSYDQRFSDSGDIFNRLQEPGAGFGDIRDITGTGDPFENKRLRLAYDLDYANGSFYVSIDFNEDDFMTENTLNQKRTGVRAGLFRSMGSGWAVRLDFDFSQNEFDAADREDDFKNITIGVQKQVTRTLSLDLAYIRSERESNVASAEYIENSIALTISYAK